MSIHQMDLHAAQSLYWEAVPFAVLSGERDKRVTAVTVRLLTGTDRHNPSLRTLRLNLSSEEDLLFLHTLEVTEEDFQTLKVDQGILVDYSSFPAKVISLLQRCMACSNEKQPRFQANLTCHGAASVLRVVETNDFNQLPHITLRFQPGDDVAIKKFLAFRLAEVKAELDTTTAALSTSQAESRSSTASLLDAQQQLQAAARQHESVLVRQEADQQSREAAALHEHSLEVAKLREQFDSERAELRQRLDDATSAAASRMADLESKNRQLADAKAQLEAKTSELSCRLGMSEGSVRALEDEAATLKSRAKEVAEERPRRMAEAADLAARLRSAEERVEAQQRTIQEQADHARGLQASIGHLEARCSELKATSTVHESRAHTLEGEGLSSTQVIDRLQGEVRGLKEKLKRKAGSLTAAQQDTATKEAELEAAALHVRRMAHQEQLLQEDLASHQDQLTSTRSKLEEAKEQLSSSEHMVRWLNTQVNEAQAQLGSTGLMSARHGHTRSVPAAQSPSVALARTMGKASAAIGSLYLPSPSSPVASLRTISASGQGLQGHTSHSKSLERILSKTRLSAGEPGRPPPILPASVDVQA